MTAAHLCALDPAFAPIVAASPAFTTTRAPDPYTALVTAVAGQQLHARAANAIIGRMIALFPGDFPTPAMLAATPVLSLRGCGFSAAKIRALHAIAAGAQNGIVPTRRQADTMTDADLIARLTTLPGIGRWTVEMLLIFTLNRPDVLPVDDFGVREGFRLLTGAETQPRPRTLAQHGARWAPYRTTAAWYLWRVADQAKASRGLRPSTPPGPAAPDPVP